VTAVQKAVLLAAGRGKRLGALTDSEPKPLLRVAGEPILHRIIAGLAAGGVAEIFVVTGYRAEQLESATGDGSRWGLSIRYARQEPLDGTARAVQLVREQLGDEPFFVGWGDIVVGEANYARVLDAAKPGSAVVAVNMVDDPSAGGAVYVDEAWQVTRIVEKPAPGTSTTNWNNAGLMVLPPQAWPFLDGLTVSDRGEYELPRALAAMVEAGVPALAVPIDGPWFDIGTPESLEAARRYFSG